GAGPRQSWLFPGPYGREDRARSPKRQRARVAFKRRDRRGPSETAEKEENNQPRTKAASVAGFTPAKRAGSGGCAASTPQLNEDSGTRRGGRGRGRRRRS